MDFSDQDKEVFLKIYIGQNIREYGILQSEFRNEKQQIQTLLSIGLIRENHWYTHQFLTTDEGSQLGKFETKLRIDAEELLAEYILKIKNYYIS